MDLRNELCILWFLLRIGLAEEVGRVRNTFRVERYAMTIGGLLLIGSLGFLVNPWFDPVRDGAIYVATARSLASGQGYSYLGMPFILRPPGFPVLFVPMVVFFEQHYRIWNLYTSLFGVLGVVLLFVHSRRRVGWPLAMLTAGIVWMNPSYQNLCNQVMADVPGTALMLACLVLDRLIRDRSGIRREFVLGAMVAAAIYVRSINIVLIPAVILGRLLESRAKGREMDALGASLKNRILVFSVTVCVLLAPWAIRNHYVQLPAPVDQVSIYDYQTGMWHRDHYDPTSPTISAAEVLRRPPMRLQQMAVVVGSRLQVSVRGSDALPDDVKPAEYFLAFLLLIGILYTLWKRREPAEWFAVGATVVLLFYFGFLDRLLLPIFVLALPATVEMLVDLVSGFSSPRAATNIVGALMIGVLLVDLPPQPNRDTIEQRHKQLLERAAAFQELSTEDMCLASSWGFFDSVYLDRPVFSLGIAVRRRGNLDAIEEVIDRCGINTLLLYPADTLDRRIFEHAQKRYPDQVRNGPVVLIRVRPLGGICGAPEFRY